MRIGVGTASGIRHLSLGACCIQAVRVMTYDERRHMVSGSRSGALSNCFIVRVGVGVSAQVVGVWFLEFAVCWLRKEMKEYSAAHGAVIACVSGVVGRGGGSYPSLEAVAAKSAHRS